MWSHVPVLSAPKVSQIGKKRENLGYKWELCLYVNNIALPLHILPYFLSLSLPFGGVGGNPGKKEQKRLIQSQESRVGQSHR